MKITCITEDKSVPEYPLLSEWGAAYIIDTPEKRILFDTGRTGQVLLHNLQTLGIDPSTIDALVFSHAHIDHTGGLEAILPYVEGKSLYGNSDLFRPRYAQVDHTFESVGMPLEENQVGQRMQIHLGDQPQKVADGVWTTGRIFERPESEGSSSNLYIRHGESWIADPYRDDLSMVLETENGLTLLCGCCHAGILNTYHHVAKRFKQPVVVVLGGIHLLDSSRHDVLAVIDYFRHTGVLSFYLNHCTGEQVIDMFRQAFGDVVHDFWAGAEIELS